jgi:UDP-N-acetylmuramate--alanine ligase
LKNFTGVRRRFEKKGEFARVTFVDDYAHHPTEIAATLQAGKSVFQKGNIHVIMQPHRYSRTQICWDQFADALSLADRVYLIDVYAAGEPSIAGIDSSSLSKLIAKSHPSCQYLGSLEDARDFFVKEMQDENRVRPGDLILTLGAGNITQLGTLILNMLASQKESRENS